MNRNCFDIGTFCIYVFFDILDRESVQLQVSGEIQTN